MINHDFLNNFGTPVRCCPFCASARAQVMFQGLYTARYGVQCGGCGASIPAKYLKSQDAVQEWNRRSGLAVIGGRATKGLKSKCKLAAAKRNLKKARKAKKLKQIQADGEVAYKLLKAARQIEMTENYALMAVGHENDSAWLKKKEDLFRELGISEENFARLKAELAVLEPQIRKNPKSRRLFDFVMQYQSLAAVLARTWLGLTKRGAGDPG